jgi:hypothetical protein
MAGLAEGVETAGRCDELPADCFAEDWAEEDQIGAEGVGSLNIFRGVAGEADGWALETGLGTNGSDLIGGEGAGTRGKVDTLGSCCKGNIGTAMEEEFRRGVGKQGENLAGQDRECSGWKIGFAKEEEVDLLSRQGTGLRKETVAGWLGGLAALMAQCELAVRDGVAQHALKFRRNGGQTAYGSG